MESLKRGEFFSKQGKASMNMHPMLIKGKKRQPKLREEVIINPSDPRQLEEAIGTPAPKKRIKTLRLSSAFTSTSRSQYEFAFRNRTESPVVGLYSPRYAVLDARVNQAPKFTKATHKPRESRITLPDCLDENFSCIYTQKSHKKHPKKNKRNQTAMGFHEYKARVHRKEIETITVGEKIIAPIDFGLQISRKPFVEPGKPPHEKRFSVDIQNSMVMSRNKRLRTVSFDKMLSRKELIDPRRSVGPYDAKETLVRVRDSKDILDFNRMLSRKPILNLHHLQTPASPDLEAFDKAFNKQSIIRGVRQMPKISSVSPRDDSMYRTHGSYSVNMPNVKILG